VNRELRSSPLPEVTTGTHIGVILFQLLFHHQVLTNLGLLRLRFRAAVSVANAGLASREPRCASCSSPEPPKNGSVAAQAVNGRLRRLPVGPPPRPLGCCWLWLSPRPRSTFVRYIDTPNGSRSRSPSSSGALPRTGVSHVPDELGVAEVPITRVYSLNLHFRVGSVSNLPDLVQKYRWIFKYTSSAEVRHLLRPSII